MTWEQWAKGAAAGITMIAGATGIYTSIARYLRERRRPRLEESRRWSFDVEPSSEECWYKASLKRTETDVSAPEMRLQALRIKSPRQSLLAAPTKDVRVGAVGYSGSWTPAPEKSAIAKKLVIAHDLKPVRVWNQDHITTRSLGYSQFDFFVSSPPKSAFWWQRSRRVTITVDAEEISSGRRSIRIKVHSQVIDWSARTPHKAT
jgi:hypothetical protein